MKEALFEMNSASPLYESGLASAEQAAELRRPAVVAWEDLPQINLSEVLRGDLAEHVAEVRRQSEVSALEELVVALEDCLSRSVSDLQTMGEAAHRRVLERHSIDIAATKLGKLFRPVCP